MPTAVQLLLDRHGAKAPRDDGSELPGRIWYNSSRTVIPENAFTFIRDRKMPQPEFLTIPDNAFGVSGMTKTGWRSNDAAPIFISPAAGGR